VFAWQANFIGVLPSQSNTQGPGGTSPVQILDLIAKWEPDDAFHIWAGRMLVPSDRSNFSGPWFMSAWNYPGLFGPKQGPFGRNNGVTAWGQFLDGKAKYYLGVFDLDDSRVKRFYSGRVNLAIIGKEPGFYHSSTYYGAQDIVAIGAAYQYQTDGDGAGQNLSLFNVDLLAEGNLGGAGVGTIEGQYIHANEGHAFRDGYFVLGSFLVGEKLGVGRLQPLVRWQQTKTPDQWVLDTFVTYVIDDYNLRVALGYHHMDMGMDGVPNPNAIQLGVQIQR